MPLLAARSARSETTNTRARQSPVCAERGAARAKIAPAPLLELGPELAARATMSPRSVTLRSKDRADELAGRLVARPLRRARALELEREQRRDHPHQRRRRIALAPAVAQLADHGIRDAQLERRRRPPSPVSSLLSSAEEVAATASTALERSISATLAPSAVPAARATAGSPAPDSIASESASSAPSSGSLAGFSGAWTREPPGIYRTRVLRRERQAG